jgi:hypothetical protein
MYQGNLRAYLTFPNETRRDLRKLQLYKSPLIAYASIARDVKRGHYLQPSGLGIVDDNPFTKKSSMSRRS